jgi:hypothetical protein
VQQYKAILEKEILPMPLATEKRLQRQKNGLLAPLASGKGRQNKI